jgi:hypothetical protein
MRCRSPTNLQSVGLRVRLSAILLFASLAYTPRGQDGRIDMGAFVYGNNLYELYLPLSVK